MNHNRNKGNVILLVIILLAVGATAGFLAGFTYQSRTLAPASHQTLVSTIIITDTEWNSHLMPVCVDAGQHPFNAHSIISLDLFEEGRVYEQSTWIWQRQGDTEFCMTLWGPGEDLQTVMLELGRLGMNGFEMQIAGDTVLTIPKATSTIDTGYYQLIVELHASA